MTKPGEIITVRGRVVEDKGDCWLCEAEAVNEGEEVKVKGSFEVKKNIL